MENRQTRKAVGPPRRPIMPTIDNYISPFNVMQRAMQLKEKQDEEKLAKQKDAQKAPESAEVQVSAEDIADLAELERLAERRDQDDAECD